MIDSQECMFSCLGLPGSSSANILNMFVASDWRRTRLNQACEIGWPRACISRRDTLACELIPIEPNLAHRSALVKVGNCSRLNSGLTCLTAFASRFDGQGIYPSPAAALISPAGLQMTCLLQSPAPDTERSSSFLSGPSLESCYAIAVSDGLGG
jgi:hypothetical protein